MSATRIEWADITVNPVVGCSKCSPGCDNCYAERFAARLAKNPQTAAKYAGVVDEAGKWTGKTSALDLSVFEGLPKKGKRVFVGSMTDIFHRATTFKDLRMLWTQMAFLRQHTFMILTKRPDRMYAFIEDNAPVPLENVWLGVTVCNQAEADAKIQVLLDTPAAKRFVSVEPMLGPVDLTALDPSGLHIPEVQDQNGLTGIIRQEIHSEASWHTVKGNRIDWVNLITEDEDNIWCDADDETAKDCWLEWARQQARGGENE